MVHREASLSREQTVIMDNRWVDVVSAGREHLEFAIALARNGHPLAEYREEGGQLVLGWGMTGEGVVPLLYPYQDTKEIADFVWGWLEKKAEHRGRCEGFGDVKNERGGFRLWTGEGSFHETAWARVEARYIWIGK